MLKPMRKEKQMQDAGLGCRVKARIRASMRYLSMADRGHARAGLVLFFALVFVAVETWARAGGAGGGHGGGGGHSGGGSHGGGSYSGGGGDANGLIFLFRLIFNMVVVLLRMGPVGWVILLALVAFVVMVFRLFTRSSGDQPGLDQEINFSSVQLASMASPVHDEFRQKITKAFLTVQAAWSQQRLDLMRRFISDGVYQRFHAQFTMMQMLKQKNLITDVEVERIEIVKRFEEGVYECLDVRIVASANDQFICETDPELNSPGGRERFVEYWSFLRRKDHRPSTDLYSSEHCPQCSAPLDSKLIESARCPYCSSYLNSGEFDWVLSEITQEQDYIQEIQVLDGTDGLNDSGFGDRVGGQLSAQVRQALPSFSKLQLEDKTSNAFMQVLIAKALRAPAPLQRFCSAELFAKFSEQLARGVFVYDRLYLNAVDTTSVNIEGEFVSAKVLVTYTYHRVEQASSGEFISRESGFITERKVLTMRCRPSIAMAKGSIYAGCCPSCGAPQASSLNHLCTHCGAALNDPTHEWILFALDALE